MKKVRYAVIGLGHIAQVAVLPAFKHARKNSELRALISSDPVKLEELGSMYRVKRTYLESEFVDCMRSGDIDAVYIATPNTDHQFYAERAAELGVHVLCEKPLAENSDVCRSIMNAVERNHIKFMVGYRLHFDPANLRAIETAQSGDLGELRLFNSTFCLNIKDQNNIRLKREKAGGPLHDIGIYCINAARYLFRAEPYEVFAMSVTNPADLRFTEVEEAISVVMKFPEDRIASFICSYGAHDVSSYDLAGSRGRLHLENAYDYAMRMKLTITIGEKTKTKRFLKHDQFAPELLYFSDCILKDTTPEPSVVEGLSDLLVIDAIRESLRKRAPVEVLSVDKELRPSARQEIRRPFATRHPSTVHVRAPSA